MKPVCEVCRVEQAEGLVFCAGCAEAFVREVTHGPDQSVLGLVVWVARRAHGARQRERGAPKVGTSLKAVLDFLRRKGEEATPVEVAREVFGTEERAVQNRVRSFLDCLRKRGLVERGERRGMWRASRGRHGDGHGGKREVRGTGAVDSVGGAGAGGRSPLGSGES